jgi:hypothetical protein
VSRLLNVVGVLRLPVFVYLRVACSRRKDAGRQRLVSCVSCVSTAVSLPAIPFRLPSSSSDQRPRLRVAHDIHVDATTFATSGHLRPRRVVSTLVPANRRWLSRITGECISNMGASSKRVLRSPASGQLRPAGCQTGNDQPSSVSRMATRLASCWQVAAPMAGAVATSIATACRSRCPTVSRRSQAGLDRVRAENVR